jgi:hypothetical protein
MRIDVHTPLHPRKLTSASRDELLHIRMVQVKVADNCSILVVTTPSQDFIEGGIDLGEGNRARCHKTLAILRSFVTDLGEVYCNARSIA